MWVLLNNAFFSIVKNRNNKNELLVRARIEGDIEKIFDNANIFQDVNADYKYRSYISREDVAKAISKELLNIEYDNFKNSVSKDDTPRISAYMNVWNALYKIQK